MNRTEQAVLNPLIKGICRSNRYLWWELKRQVWDGGFQTFYPRQGEYDSPVQTALDRLMPEVFETLSSEFGRRFPAMEPTEVNVKSYYEAVMMEEIVRRASVAAYRTVHW